MASSAALKMIAMCMLVLFAGQLLMATPAAADGRLLQGVSNRRSLQAAVPNCGRNTPANLCVKCAKLCVGDCNKKTGRCEGTCITRCVDNGGFL